MITRLFPGATGRSGWDCRSSFGRRRFAKPGARGERRRRTRRVAGKAQVRRLTPERAEGYRPYFENNRRLRELLSELEALSIRAVHGAEGWGEK